MKAMERDKLLSRIRKLYAMSRESESSPHEAEIAMRRCQSLMARFGVSEADLETPEFRASTIGRAFRAVPGYVGVLASAVALLHDCLCVKSDTIEFRGFSIDAEVASLTNAYLTESMERSLKSRKREGAVAPGRSASFDYRMGYALAILARARRIDAERKQAEAELEQAARDACNSEDAGKTGSSLILRKLEVVRQACMDGVVAGRTQRVRYRSGAAHLAGSNDGALVSLERQLASSTYKVD